jgi:plasmid stabilization system protein ParE
MNEYVLSQRARHELREIWDFIAADDIEAADVWIARLIKQFQLLAHNPRIGHERTDLTDRNVLFWPVEKYLIIYRPVGDNVRILAVTQGSRDIPSYVRKRS